jgi:hypothetical protein
MEAINIAIEAILLNLDDDSIKKQLRLPLTRVAGMFVNEISEESGIDLVYQFIKHYIVHVSDCNDILATLAERYRLQVIVEPCLSFAGKYFSATQKQVLEEPTSDSLKIFLSLLESAYIFHRLAEELDDRIQNFIGVPLSSLDRVNANLNAHEIIGDRFANKLDKAILSVFQQSLVTKAIVEAQLDKNEVNRQQKEKRSLSGEEIICFATENQLSMRF